MHHNTSVSSIMQSVRDAYGIKLQVLSIKRKLSKLPNSQSDKCIFRVHDQLQIANERCYEPEIISIGPYHRSNDDRHYNDKMKAKMEERKLYYLKSFLNRRAVSVEKYYKAMRDLEEEARKCYDQLPQEFMNSQEFTEMMLLDGCFIIELLRKVNNSSLIDDEDPIFEMNWMRNALVRDLMLFENQIPFFVLHKLFEMSSDDHNNEVGDEENKDLIELAMKFFYPLVPGYGHRAENSPEIDWSGKNLLELLYHNWLPPFVGIEILIPDEKNKNWSLIPCASELVEFGVKFKKSSEKSCLLDITFVNGTMQIPCITIENRTECFLRNLIAFEEYYQDIRQSHIICYVKFLDCLIRSKKDVKILVQHGIIDNWLGDDEAVSEIFNRINHGVTAPATEKFQYCDIFNEVNVYCNRRVNRWMANLKRKYLNSPWAIISVIAGFVLILLSLIQTIFSILAYFK